MSGLDEENDASRSLQFRNHFLQRLCTDHFSAFGFVLQEVLHLGHRPVVSAYLKVERKWILSISKKLIIINEETIIDVNRKRDVIERSITYNKAVIVHVQDQVLSHHGQTNQSNIRSVQSGNIHNCINYVQQQHNAPNDSTDDLQLILHSSDDDGIMGLKVLQGSDGNRLCFNGDL